MDHRFKGVSTMSAKVFTNQKMSIYGVMPDYTTEGISTLEQHQMSLHHGLALLPENFVCELCWRCKGTTKEDFYGCAACEGTGLTQGGGVASATDSQRHQVLEAATRSILLPFEVKVL
jgi:hypothetical protein